MLLPTLTQRPFDSDAHGVRPWTTGFDAFNHSVPFLLGKTTQGLIHASFKNDSQATQFLSMDTVELVFQVRRVLEKRVSYIQIRVR